MSAALKTKLTTKDYLELERASSVRHEWHNGEMIAMAGASKAHNLIALSIASSLRQQLKGKPCKAFITDLKLAVASADLYFYPDIMVICGKDAFIEEDITSDAAVIIEVLSESTEAFDRGMKFKFYQSLRSLKEYVLVSQHKMQVERYEKISKSEWHYTILDLPEKQLELVGIGARISVAEIYEEVEFKTGD
jgi:Uma2 family endonuclease